MILTYANHQIVVDPEDSDLLRSYSWRVLLSKGNSTQVVTSVNRDGNDQRRKGNLYLAYLIAERMGLPVHTSRVIHSDGDGLNNTRSNLAAHGRHGVCTGPKRQPLSNPPGLHRHKVGTARPPMAYDLCDGPKDESGVCVRRNVVATAYRLARPSGLWQIRLSTGEYLIPCRWTEIRNSLALVRSADEAHAEENQLILLRVG